MIIVPSKNRAGKSQTIMNLLDEAIPFAIALEESQVVSYKEVYGNITICPVTPPDKGMGTVRSCMIEYGRLAGEKWIWILDDDITSWCYRDTSGMHRASFGEALLRMAALREEYVDDSTFMCGPCYVQSLRAYHLKDVRWNRNIGTAYCVSTDPKFAKYDTNFSVRDDILFQLRNWTSGWDSARFENWGFRCPPMGGMQGGGSEDFFRAGRAKSECLSIADEFDFVDVYQRNGDWRLKINWRAVDAAYVSAFNGRLAGGAAGGVAGTPPAG